jgi:hypothetical protein
LVGAVGVGVGVVVWAGASVNFDVSVFEVVGTLSVGGCVEVGRDVLELEERSGWLESRRDGSVVLSGVPSVLGGVVGGLCGVGGSAVCGVVFAGEGLSWGVVDRVRGVFPGVRVVNAYGQSETFYVSVGVVGVSGGVSGGGFVGVGVPLGGVWVVVLDGGLGVVPPGVVGEVYVGGLSVGRGYWGGGGLTAGRFVADVCGGGGRLFRTGDLGRVSRGGVLEFVGRVDDQVKVRGVRVELGEVEGVVGGFPGVGQVAVKVWSGEDAAAARLVAYVVPEPGVSLSTGELRAFVSGRLPDYFVPSVFVVVGRLPLTPSGKVDRAALPEPVVPDSETSYRAPRSERESRLCVLFGEVLGVDRVGIDDDFFVLGGHSLLATRLAGRIRAEFGGELLVSKIFDNPTVAGLSDLVVSAEAARPLLRRRVSGGGVA